MASKVSVLEASHRRIFTSVFPQSSTLAIPPTQQATPEAGFVAPGRPFGGPLAEKQLSADPNASFDIVGDQLRWNRAWHTATSFLSLPNEPIEPMLAKYSSSTLKGVWNKRLKRETQEALEYIVMNTPLRATVERGAGQEDILEWYINEIRRHFLTYGRPNLTIDNAKEDEEEALTSMISTLKAAQLVYLTPVTNHILPIYAYQCDPITEPERWELIQIEIRQLESKFRRDFHTIVTYSLPQDFVSTMLRGYLKTECATIVGLPRKLEEWEIQESEPDPDESMDLDSDVSVMAESEDAKSARQKLIPFMRDLQAVGLGGGSGERVFAEVMNTLMTDYVRTTFSRQWKSPSKAPAKLKYWVENKFARLAVEVLDCIQTEDQRQEDSRTSQVRQWKPGVSLDDVVKWQEMGMERLGRLRVEELFDVVVDWDESKGAIEDLKAYITLPATRTYLTTSFTGVLSRRLLHPGASTFQIVKVYIALIRSFGLLDPKGVLLDRVARPIRRYLRDREDAVKVVVAGMVADTEDEDGDMIESSGEVLVELARELSRAAEFVGQGVDDSADLDWDDMRWVPDPIDAGPEYKRSKSSDVIGSVISLFDPKDVFIQEFQDVMGERLLQKDFDLQKETRILELLKLRFDEGALQACMVMLRDISDSKRIDASIRLDQSKSAQPPSPTHQPPPTIHAKILSRLFWPSLHNEPFTIPPAITSLQASYEAGFESLKASRKLSWLNMLGSVTVELDLADRHITEVVTPWQASVIYAFGEDDDDNGTDTSNTTRETTQPKTLSIPALTARLAMPLPLLHAALSFWTSRRVLRAHPSSPSAYSVIETLSPSSPSSPPPHPSTSSTAATAPTPTISAIRSADDLAHDRLRITWQFIQGMLTNRGPMPLQAIVSMLQFALPGGLPCSPEELREWLAGLVNDERLEMVGGRYKIRG